MIYQEVYTSVAKAPMQHRDVEAILNTARRNNMRAALSGLLVVYENRFLQVLEGDEDRVKARLECIYADPRHHRVQVLRQQIVPQRVFSGWKMGFAQPDELHAETRDAVFSIYDLTQGTADVLGQDDEVAKLVRRFLASFGLMGAAGAAKRQAAGVDLPAADNINAGPQ